MKLPNEEINVCAGQFGNSFGCLDCVEHTIAIAVYPVKKVEEINESVTQFSFERFETSHISVPSNERTYLCFQGPVP